MEVADLWRREWAGTAEFGKVTEGGVTRQVARAMEVLHASTPGARVRVMRAAYHSTAGPGIPASSYMLHSSRRVISSGFNLLESPSFPSKPLEISSTPLESFPDLNTDTEDYKVTEPDDTEISEPSKWKAASSGTSLRMPSEESSSIDNASVIDLDNRFSHRSIFRKHSYDSDNSDILSSRKSSAQNSPLIDTPVTLSTLKFKSLLNNSNDWNHRRKSYSFEDTCPANESIIHSNDILAMESSTDSGICKSTEIVNDQGDDNTYFNSFGKPHKSTSIHDETFKDWLHKNRTNASYKSTQLKPWRQHETVIEDPIENTVSLKSPGKVCINIPITIEKDDNRCMNEDSDRRIKKVEFCKTELHFAAESGKVNIIATDEKPPPTNDFRKRRSAFVPITDRFEKPITLFGDRVETSDPIKKNSFSIYGNSKITQDEIENTAATKSILKNKIPKPKPYLLGENTVLGNSDNIYDKDRLQDPNIASGVSLINKQLESESKYSNEKISTFTKEIGTGYRNNVRTVNKGLTNTESHAKKKVEQTLQNETTNVSLIKKKPHAVPLSPVATAKTRQLRDSDLMYFGIDNGSKNIQVKEKAKCFESVLTTNANITDDIFQSVKLIKRISNSACNSEAESEDTAEYQNIIQKPHLSQPIPKPRSKYNTAREIHTETTLQPIVEQYSDRSVHESRRSRSKKYEDIVVPTPRSRSEPAKKKIAQDLDKIKPRDNVHTNSIKRTTPSPRMKKYQDMEQRRRKPSPIKKDVLKNSISEDEAPLYVNIKAKHERFPKSINPDWNHQNSQLSQDIEAEAKVTSYKTKRTVQECSLNHNRLSPDKTKAKLSSKQHTCDSLEKRQKSTPKTSKTRTKKLVTPELSLCDQPKNEEISDKKLTETIVVNEYSDTDDKLNTRHKQRSQSSHRKTIDEKDVESKETTNTEEKDKRILKNNKRHAANEPHSGKETSKNHKIYGHSLNGDLKSINTVGNRDYDDSMNSRKIMHRTPRSEYVINYDDKNGTVSSICKIKPGYSNSKRKTAIKEKGKDSPKEIKHKTLDRTPLLQLPEQQWNRNGLSQENRKWKIKNRVQRSCQIL